MARRDYNARIAHALLSLVVLVALATRPSPAHARLFAPPARAADFTFETTPAGIEEVAREFRARWPASNPGSWRIDRAGAGDLFDGAALFDRSRLARLYGGRAARVARGPITSGATVVEVVQLLSPYPEPGLDRLNRGTLIMRVRVRQRTASP